MRDTFDLPECPTPKDTRPPLIVDSFAGGGGASTGIEMALGRSPDIAINHNPAALALHAANHPDTLHLSENVYRVDPLDHLAGRHIGLMWFSPDCKHFSKAKGGKPVARNIRDLAWIIPGWIERIQKSGGKVDVVMMENVEEWKDWGPLVETERGLMPCPDRKGETFALWRKRIRALGGRIELRELRGCDYGSPTIRKRLFVIIRFDKRPIIWPEPTHGAPDSEGVKTGKLLPWRTAAECIDWTLPCPSIFDTKAEIREKHGLNAVRPLARNTMARVARGLRRYVIDAERPYLVSTNSPIRASGMVGGFPVAAAPCHAEETGVCITDTIRGYGGTPLRSGVTAGETAPFLASIAHGDSGGRREYPVSDPYGVVTAGGISHAVVAPTLMRHFGTSNGADIALPAPTIMADGGGKTALIAPVLTYAQQGGACRSIEDPHHTICASKKDQNAVIAATMIQTGYGEREGQAPRALDLARPLGTVVAGGSKHAPVAAFLAQQNGGPRMARNAGHDPRMPMSTVTGTGSHQNPVAAFFAKYYGTGDGAEMDDPMHTVTVKDRMGHIEAEVAAPPFSREHEAKARKVADLLREHGLWDEREFVTVEIGETTFVIVDVGMRMLTPRELFNAQGFPPDYVIEGIWHEEEGDWRFEPFAKDVQVSCVGNSVCPDVAAALAGANCGHMAVREVVA
ncbi:DNA methyltransferase [Salipiger sp.]|uniref:DNA methyltransferase n=1 Tax=Salipiger sp. TaxID=2078585 RepID=UPI003A98419F